MILFKKKIKKDNKCKLIYNQTKAKKTKQLKSKRVVTLFSSHAEEEKMFSDIFRVLSKDISDLFFIIIPRHINRIKKL